MEKVNFSELVDQVDLQLYAISRDTVKLVAESIFQQIAENSLSGKNTQIKNFGTFSLNYQWVHADLNPKTDKMKLILDLDFQPCQRLKKEIASKTFELSVNPIEKLKDINL